MAKRTLAAVVMFVVCASAVWAHPGNAQRRMDRRDHLARIAERLELTPSQIEAIREIRESQRAKQRELREEMKSVAVQYRDLRDAGDPGADRAMERLRALRDESRARRLAGRADFERILTPEQRDRIRQHRGKRQ